MKPIDVSQIRRVAQAQALTDLMDAQNNVNQLDDEEVRSAYIRRNYGKWSAIKENLWNLGDLKCW